MEPELSGRRQITMRGFGQRRSGWLGRVRERAPALPNLALTALMVVVLLGGVTSGCAGDGGVAAPVGASPSPSGPAPTADPSTATSPPETPGTSSEALVIRRGRVVPAARPACLEVISGGERYVLIGATGAAVQEGDLVEFRAVSAPAIRTPCHGVVLHVLEMRELWADSGGPAR